MRRSILTLGIATALAATLGCSSQNNPHQQAIQELSAPTIALEGTGTNTIDATMYLYADSTGAINSADNEIIASFGDPYLPLSLSSTSLFTDTTTSGSCTTLTPLVGALGGSPAYQVTTLLAATGCTDQAIIKVSLDTTKVTDNQGLAGTDVATIDFIVDMAPTVSVAATGNTETTGSGTTNTSAGQFSEASDLSIVVKFSKDMSSDSLVASWTTTCGATLASSGTIVPDTDGEIVAWAVTNPQGVTVGDTCTMEVTSATDAAGNALDSTGATMVVTFEN
jgi:uncharacterized protein YdeI (BOF family)